jgi:hypothetical protein
MGTWKNSDNLFVKLGTSEAASLDTTKGAAGEYLVYGDKRVTEVILDLTDLNTSTDIIINDVAIFPKNARIEEVELVTQTAATSGGAATLDVGFIQNADRTTDIDQNGLIAAAALATFNAAGERLNLIVGSTGAGALIGTTTTLPALLTAKAGTATFTAGVVRIRVKWYAV